MKLARIEHWRCGEPMWRDGGGYTYVWVPDDWAAETLEQHAEAAQKSYLDAEQEFRKLAPLSPPGYNPAIMPGTPDAKTVGELRAEHEVQAKAYKEYQAAMEKSRKPFVWHLNQTSGGSAIQFWDRKPDLEAEISWGHSHGITIDHSPTEIGDYPFPQEDNDV